MIYVLRLQLSGEVVVLIIFIDSQLCNQRLYPLFRSKLLELFDIANKFCSIGFKHMRYNLHDKICLILL